MTNIIYGKETAIPKKYMEIRQKYFGIAEGGFDIISSQFSLHYYFQSQTTFEGFIRNLKDGYHPLKESQNILSFLKKQKNI